MSQETNLNVAPYFDDFDANNDYYKVLFKPGYPVQARELTTLQSILQNQVERFGQHFFKEGAKVIPGNTSYNNQYNCVQIENSYLGIPLADYCDQLVGAKITGQRSGVTAIVDKVLKSSESERGQTTLYITYLGSNSTDNSTVEFSDGELLSSNIVIASSNTIIAANEPFGETIPVDSAAVGSSFSIADGVYFAKGQFLNVSKETFLLDQYGDRPSYRVGLLITEEIINADIDSSLNDNSKGFNNYSAPGADRLKMTTSLFKKDVSDYDDNNFIELATISNGVLRSKKTTTDYNIIESELARRTYAESGDYYVTPFDLSVKESLNNGTGNRGVFASNQQTYGGSSPAEDLALYQVSPGKAYVKGYEVETISSSYLDVQKPRTLKVLNNQSINYETGSTIKLNRVEGSPVIGIGNTFILSLRDSRVGEDGQTIPGKEIGVARVYDFNLSSGAYVGAGVSSALNEWDMSLYDIQTVTHLTLNEPITLSTPTFIKGAKSGATAFLKEDVAAGTALTVYDKKGEFITDESFIFDGVSNNRVSIAVTSLSLTDVKSVSNVVGAAATFTADVIQRDSIIVGVSSISAVDAATGLSTVSSTDPAFPEAFVRVGDLVKFSNQTSQYPAMASVVSVGSSLISISGVATVTGVVDGKLPATKLDVSDFRVVATSLENSGENSLYTEIPRENVAEIDLSESQLIIRKTFDVNISNNQLSSPVLTSTNETFLPFSAARYDLIKKDGTTEVLTEDKVKISAGGGQLEIKNLSDGTDDATLVTTIKKLKPKSKVKLKNRVNSIVIDNSDNPASGITTTSLGDGLVYGDYPYGTRVQDETICLRTPDVINIHAIFESVDINDASAPTFILSSISGPTAKTTDLIIGEKITGRTSGAVAIVAERISDTKISFIAKNSKVFKEGETLLFEESNINAVLTTVDTPSINISQNYTFGNGQKSNFYDFGYITRKNDAKAPVRQLRVYFTSGYYQSTDDGDITTVESYDTFHYGREISSVNGVRNSDIIDIRPRVSDYAIATGGRSPLEFYGRTFDATGNSSANILASNESIVADYSFYLGRIDRVYVTKDGKLQVKYGVPSEKPEKPVSVDDALEIATVQLPPYLYNVSDASVDFLSHKRYRMQDIKKLEERIKTLEYYTSLSLLETNTANLFVADSNGLNRFKSGFYVDNFTTFLAQENGLQIKNSIDAANKLARAQHYTTAVDLTLGPVENVNANSDLNFVAPEGNAIRKTGDVITLDYTEVEWLAQTFATRTESVTPFMISFWEGSVDLNPASDTWVDTVRIEARTVNTEGNFANTVSEASRQFGVDPQTGMAPVVWNGWQTNWTGSETTESTRVRSERRSRTFRTGNEEILEEIDTTVRETLSETIDTGVSSRTGTRTVVTEVFDTFSAGDRTVSRDLIQFIRSRNVDFTAERVKPVTRHYVFMDGVDMTQYTVPKLVEISMISGTFQVGELVVGRTRPTGQIEESTNDARISFRLAVSNHKAGPFNAPTSRYTVSPYDGTTIPSIYSSTSTLLNVDSVALGRQPQSDFIGYVEPEMILVGQTSGAEATVSQVRLVSDIAATLQGNLFLPDPNVADNPRFEVGTKVVTFTDDENNNQLVASSIAEDTFTAAGTLETVQETVVSVRNARVEQRREFEERAAQRTTGTQVIDTQTLSSQRRARVIRRWGDPLAQSFQVDDPTGIFLTSCDIFFESKDDAEIPVTIQIRTMQAGTPTQTVLPFSEVNLAPSEVNVSQDASAPTTFTFKSPIYLEAGVDYSIVLLSVSTKYNVFISRVGENDLQTQTFISTQPYLGSLFKSQNASTWEPSQWEDLKFTLRRADFVNNGSVQLYSPELAEGNNQIAKLRKNPLELTSRQVRLGISSALNDDSLAFGNTILQDGLTATGKYVANAGIATDALNVIAAGIGYTPVTGASVQFSSVPLVTVTGHGRNATADVTVQNGEISAATIADGGTGYSPGDVLGIGTIGTADVGFGARLSLVSIASTNELILDDVQGTFNVIGVGNSVQYINSSGVTTHLNAPSHGNVRVFSVDVVNDGLHINVNHRNHGMYFDDNMVTISDVKSDLLPVKLNNPLNATSTAPISVSNVDELGLFEGVGVGTTNLGYLKIGQEIISYSNTNGSTVTGEITRGVDNTTPKSYPAGTLAYKYELDGVSLRRINKTHNMNNVTVANPITFDSYNVKLDMGASGVGRSTAESFPPLFLKDTKSAGGAEVHATQNIPFELITPNVQNLTVPGTTISAELRTVSAQSISGSEIPYRDQGFEPITLNNTNYLTSPRIVASKVNETAKLGTMPGNKSLAMTVNMDTLDTRVSPVIDTQRINAIFTSNRVNSVITNYAEDSRVNTIFEDPTACQYLSKEIELENPASSLKIILNAHIAPGADIRAFYSVSEDANFEPVYVPFPGYDNLDDRGQIINSALNDGHSDAYVSPSQNGGIDESEVVYKEYTFTADTLPTFKAYRIKILMTSESQVYVPRMKDLRVIALA